MSRGRGRGAPVGYESTKSPSTGSDQRTKSPSTLQELGKYLYSLTESNIDKLGDRFADMVLQFASNDEKKLKEALGLILDATFESKTNAELGAKVCEKIIKGPAEAKEEVQEKSSFRTLFRTALLSRLHEEYMAKDSVRAQSIEVWLAVFAFMYQVYVRVHVGKDPILIVGKAIMEGMKHTLELPDVIDDELECMCDCLKVCGLHVEAQHPALLEHVMNILRTKCVSAKSTCRARCLCLEVIELRLMGWKDPEKQLQAFYRDALPDAIAEDELNNS